MSDIKENESHAPLAGVGGSVFRPKNGHELLKALQEDKKCEVANSHAFKAASALEGCGFSYQFKLSKWNKGWAGFERLF